MIIRQTTIAERCNRPRVLHYRGLTGLGAALPLAIAHREPWPMQRTNRQTESRFCTLRNQPKRVRPAETVYPDDNEAEISEPSGLAYKVHSLRILPSFFQALCFSFHVIM